MIKNDYRRSLIMLRTHQPGYSGHVRLERRTLMGSMFVVINVPSNCGTLCATLVRRDTRGAYFAARMGELRRDGRGQATLAYSFDPRNIDGKPLDDYWLIAIVNTDEEGNCNVVLSGNVNGSREVSWNSVRAAACAACADVRPPVCDVCPAPCPEPRPIPPVRPTPSQPAEPVTPEFPTPSLPAEPAQPAEPVTPEFPTPSLPAEPAQPAEPVTPEFPTPSLPAEPAQPAEPVTPELPTPSLPSEPAQPAEPVTPEFPTPSLPAEPAQPAEPVTPEFPTPALPQGSSREPSEMSDGGNTMSADRVPADDLLPEQDAPALAQSVRSAAEEMGIDASAPWPGVSEQVRALFASRPVKELMLEDGYTYVEAPMPEDAGYDHVDVGLKVEDGIPASVSYALPSHYTPEPPPGLDGYLWQGGASSGWWTLKTDARTGEPLA